MVRVSHSLTLTPSLTLTQGGCRLTYLPDCLLALRGQRIARLTQAHVGLARAETERPAALMWAAFARALAILVVVTMMIVVVVVVVVTVAVMQQLAPMVAMVRRAVAFA